VRADTEITAIWIQNWRSFAAAQRGAGLDRALKDLPHVERGRAITDREPARDGCGIRAHVGNELLFGCTSGGRRD